MTKYTEVRVKYSTPGTGTTNGFIFQTINSLKKSLGANLTFLDCKAEKHEVRAVR